MAKDLRAKTHTESGHAGGGGGVGSRQEGSGEVVELSIQGSGGGVPFSETGVVFGSTEGRELLCFFLP